MDASLVINGQHPESPVSIGYGLQDLSSDNSKRDGIGKMHKDIIAQKRTLDCKWGILSVEQCSLLLKSVNLSEFPVSYLDLLDGKRETRSFYVGDRSVPEMIIQDNGIYVSDVSFTLVEV